MPVGEVGDDIGMFEVETAGCGIETIGLFRHRHADDADIRVLEPRQQAGRIARRHMRLQDRPDHLRRRT